MGFLCWFGHRWGPVVAQAEDRTVAAGVQRCYRCGIARSIEVKCGHLEWLPPKDGTQTCKGCGATKEAPKLIEQCYHPQWTAVEEAGGMLTTRCVKCGHVRTLDSPRCLHTWGEAVVNKRAVGYLQSCTKCNEVRTVEGKCAHAWGNPVETPVLNKHGFLASVEIVTTCTLCNEVKSSSRKPRANELAERIVFITLEASPSSRSVTPTGLMQVVEPMETIIKAICRNWWFSSGHDTAKGTMVTIILIGCTVDMKQLKAMFRPFVDRSSGYAMVEAYPTAAWSHWGELTSANTVEVDHVVEDKNQSLISTNEPPKPLIDFGAVTVRT